MSILQARAWFLLVEKRRYNRLTAFLEFHGCKFGLRERENRGDGERRKDENERAAH